MEKYRDNSLINRYNESMDQQNKSYEKIPMHPDDFNALLAWITARRFQEMGAAETLTETPVYYGIIG